MKTKRTSDAEHPQYFANRTMWTGDNLDVLRGLNSAWTSSTWTAVQQQPELRAADRERAGGHGVPGHLDAFRCQRGMARRDR